MCYQHHLDNGDNTAAIASRHRWLNYQELVYLKEDEEIVNSKCNHWKLLNKKNPKKMWELIDWSDSTQKKEQTIPSNVIENYFRGIFQAQFLTCNPTIHDALNIIENYEQQCEVTDKDVDMEELKRAVPKMKSGLGIDSISPKVVSVVPNPLLEIILKLFNGVFGNYQLAAWNSQLLMSFPKKGHTFRNPSIGIGRLLSRLFDVILNNRFRCWYKPNIEQAGFREKTRVFTSNICYSADYRYVETNRERRSYRYCRLRKSIRLHQQISTDKNPH